MRCRQCHASRQKRDVRKSEIRRTTSKRGAKRSRKKHRRENKISMCNNRPDHWNQKRNPWQPDQHQIGKAQGAPDVMVVGGRPCSASVLMVLRMMIDCRIRLGRVHGNPGAKPAAYIAQQRRTGSSLVVDDGWQHSLAKHGENRHPC